MCKTCGCKDAETLEGEDCGCKHENEAESFGADDVDWMKRFVNNKLTQDDIRQANAWSWVAGKKNKHIEKDWLASGDLVGEEDTGTVNGMTFFEYLVMRHRNFTRDWEKGIKPTRNGIEYGSSLFSAEDKTKFELLGSKYIEGVGIVTEGSPYLKNYYGEMDEYNIYDDDAAEIIMSIPVNDARFPLKGGEIELIRAMVYGFEHPRINDSWGELNEDGMFWTTKVMETLANYDSSEAESFGAERRYVVAGQKLAIIYRIDRDDKTADILGVLPSYAEGKKAMTYMFKSALEEYSEYSEEDLMSFSDGKKEFAWYESRSKKKKSLDFYHPTGYEDIIIVLKEFRIKTLTDFYDMINEGKFSAETFNAESFGAESKFDKLAKEIAEEYEEKGKSPKEAMEIGEATAAKIGRAKFGKRKFAKMGKKAEDDIDFDEAKADRNKDGRISDWERAVGNKVAKGIRESKRAEVGPHVPTRIAATTTPRGVVKTYTSIPAGDGHVVGQFTPDMDYAPSGMYGAESLTSSIEKGFGAVLGIMSGLIVGGFAMGAVSSLSKDDENRE